MPKKTAKHFKLNHSSGIVTQKMIADQAGVSQSMVSRVLSDKAKPIGISEKTIKRVMDTANQMGYHPNPGVSIMQGRKTKLLGVIVRSFQDPFLGIILDEINREAHAAGLHLLVKGFEKGNYDDAEMQSLLRYAPDALILVGTMDFKSWNPAVLNWGKLIVQIGARANVPNVISCGMDEADAARQIANHLKKLGHKNCAIVGNVSLPTQIRTERLTAAFKTAGIQTKKIWHSFSRLSYFEAGEQAVENLCASFGEHPPFPFSAVVAVGDTIAMGFIKGLERKGIQVPQDLSLCSYNNLDFASFSKPSFTTIHQPLREMAKSAIRIVSGELKPKTVRLKATLVVRESTAVRR